MGMRNEQVENILMWYKTNKRDLIFRRTKDPYWIWVSEVMAHTINCRIMGMRNEQVENILMWYKTNKRDLIFRRTKDPYWIWVSEVMAQQTQIATMLMRNEQVENILMWYKTNKRDLIFRRTKDPYWIWVSEVMAQQTQIATMLPYYSRWMEKYPTIADLAKAEIQDVYALWHGLGYYNRATNLVKGAQYIVKHYGNHYPTTYQQWLQVNGVGPYIAAAIASICFDEKVASIDGNVNRVVARFNALDLIQGSAAFAKSVRNQVDNWLIDGRSSQLNQALMEMGALVCTKVNALDLIQGSAAFAKSVRNQVDNWLIDGRSSQLNQALMEMGALVCTKANPKCECCPLSKWCKGKEDATVYPKKKAKKANPVESYLVGFIVKDGKVAIEMPPYKDGLLSGYYRLPTKHPKKKAKKANPVESYLVGFIVKDGKVAIEMPPYKDGLLSGYYRLPTKPAKLNKNYPIVKHIFSHKTWLLQYDPAFKLDEKTTEWIDIQQLINQKKLIVAHIKLLVKHIFSHKTWLLQYDPAFKLDEKTTEWIDIQQLINQKKLIVAHIKLLNKLHLLKAYLDKQ